MSRTTSVEGVRLIALMSALLLTLSLGEARAEGGARQRVAVVEIKNFSYLSPPELMHLSDVLRREVMLALGRDFDVMTREQVEMFLEDPKALEACLEGCELKFAQAVQARWVISGSLLPAESGVVRGMLKLHDARDSSLAGSEEVSGDSRDALARSLKAVTPSLLSHLIGGDGIDERAARATRLSVSAAPPLEDLKPLGRFGMPSGVFVDYDAAVGADKDPNKSPELKIEAWSKLTSLSQYPTVRDQARGRVAYWSARLQHRARCEALWLDLSRLAPLKHVISEEERREAFVDFLDRCGRDPRENPSVTHPALQAIISAEQKAIMAQKQAEAARRAEAEVNVEALSPLDVLVGVSHGVRAEGLSYHARVRLQPQALLSRALFLDAYAAVVSTPSTAQDLWGGELGGLVGLQWINHTRWAPSLSLGYARSRGAGFGLAEVGMRYLYAPDWLKFGISAQYLKGLSLQETQAELERNAKPTGPLDPARSVIPRLDRLSGEVRLTLWVDTGLKGLLVGGLLVYLLANMDQLGP